MIMKLLLHKKKNVSIERDRVVFQLESLKVVMPKRVGIKILELIKKRHYSLIEEMIDIYKDNIVTNFGM